MAQGSILGDDEAGRHHRLSRETVRGIGTTLFFAANFEKSPNKLLLAANIPISREIHGVKALECLFSI
jgi:hypothetical protein